MNVPASAAAQAVLQGRALEVSTFAQWREAARGLLRAGVPPEAVTWGAPGGGRPVLGCAGAWNAPA